MPSDLSRNTFDPRKHYVDVLEQQGRVRTDAEANEQGAIARHRTRTDSRDVVGASGAPQNDAGFAVFAAPGGRDLLLSPGRMYVDGRLCELEADAVSARLERGATDWLELETLSVDGGTWRVGDWVRIEHDGQPWGLQVTGVDAQRKALQVVGVPAGATAGTRVEAWRATSYLTQPDLPSPPFAAALGSPPSSPPSSPPTGTALSLPDGDYLAYLEAFDREITALEDRRIREVALGGPDTTTRVRNVWQVHLLPLAAGSPPRTDADSVCDQTPPEWDAVTAAPTGKLNARTVAAPPAQNPCELPPGSGYRRLENQLYRVEVQQGGSRAQTRFKWSRDNGTVVTPITAISGTRLTVSETGKDAVLSFGPGQWAEIYDDESELMRSPRALVRIEAVDAGKREITVAASQDALAGRSGLKLRRWDQAGAAATAQGVSAGAGWLALEDGLEVQFSEGTYRTGDYWLIPARTATAEIEWPPYEVPNLNPVEQAPLGVERSFCRLAAIRVVEGQITVRDCRKTFPPLTEICAEDVCFDDGNCDLGGAETVQEAIDQLCRNRDLRFHNKHLHGTGIVCGLQVRCGPDADRPRAHVTVQPGYAIDCEGRDLVLDDARVLDVPRMAEEAGVALDDARELCLLIDSDGRDVRFRVEPPPPRKKAWAEALEGTLLLDFWTGCVKPLVDVLRDAVEDSSPPSEKGKPTEFQKSASAMTTLWGPQVSGRPKQAIWLTGAADDSEPNSDHAVLKRLYDRLLAAAKSKTACGLLDDLRPFPKYPLEGKGVRTHYGKDYHSHFRASPDGRWGFAWGEGNQILVYGLRSGSLGESTFPSEESVRVADVVASPDGKKLYAVGHAGKTDSIFAAAEITDKGLAWGVPATICGVRMESLATVGKRPVRVYATGRGKGLFEINPENVAEHPEPIHAFAATGGLEVLAEEDFAYATASESGKDLSRYDEVVRVPLGGGRRGRAGVKTYPLMRGEERYSGDDGFTVAAQGRGAARLVVAVDSPSKKGNKQALFFDALEGGESAKAPDVALLDGAGPVRMAHNAKTSFTMAAHEESNQITLLNPATGRPEAYSHPTGALPRALGLDGDGERVYVLNHGSNNVYELDAGLFQPSRQPNQNVLVKYRAEAAEAFVDLFGAVLQSLKDCLCDLLLTNCPECDEDDKLYLASVRLRQGEVESVCNFSKRKHVQTFPKLYYWLSLVPILPLAGYLVEKFCCLQLGPRFARFEASGEGNAGPQTNKALGGLIAMLGGVQRGDLALELAGRMPQLGLAPEMLVDFLGDLQKPTKEPEAAVQSDVTGLPAEEAKKKLHELGVKRVDVVTAEEQGAFRGLADAMFAQRGFGTQDHVTLVESGGVVRYARRAAPASAEERALQEGLQLLDEKDSKLAEELSAANERLRAAEALGKDLTRLDAEVSKSSKRIAAEVADSRSSAEKEIAAAKAGFEAELRKATKAFEGELKKRDKELAGLREKAASAGEALKQVAQIRKEISKLQAPAHRQPIVTKKSPKKRTKKTSKKS